MTIVDEVLIQVSSISIKNKSQIEERIEISVKKIPILLQNIIISQLYNLSHIFLQSYRLKLQHKGIFANKVVNKKCCQCYMLLTICNLYNHQTNRKLSMKIEQNDVGAIYTQNIGNEKIKSRRLLKQIFEKQSQFKFYGWDYCQNYTYITYLKYFKNIFDSPEARKRAKVFTHLSKLLATRTSNQIKCHHQKMMIRHKSINGIIQYLRMKIIKYLRHHQEAVPQIERINAQCQHFFIQESGFENRVQQGLQHKKNKEVKKPKKQTSPPEATDVKQEDNMDHYDYVKLKNSEIQEQNVKIECPEENSSQD